MLSPQYTVIVISFSYTILVTRCTSSLIYLFSSIIISITLHS
nr:MAG TPA: hypothetical protein [Caudoviricetes sp.]